MLFKTANHSPLDSNTLLKYTDNVSYKHIDQTLDHPEPKLNSLMKI